MSRAPLSLERGNVGREGVEGEVKERLSTTEQHRKPPLTQIQTQVEASRAASVRTMWSPLLAAKCIIYVGFAPVQAQAQSLLPETTLWRPGRKLTIWHHDKRALATMMHACQSPDRLQLRLRLRVRLQLRLRLSVPAAVPFPVAATALSHFSAWLARRLL